MTVKSLVRRSVTLLMEKIAGAAFGPLVAFRCELGRSGLPGVQRGFNST
jgi:hypothetical protein